MRTVLAEAPALANIDIDVILTYLDNSPITLDRTVIEATLSELIPDRKERIMGWLTQPYYDKGHAEGEVRGKVLGKAELLTQLLERRFGEIPALLRERILSANIESIEKWVERAFDAPDLQSVFELS